MKSRLVILALVGLTAGVVGTVGSKIVGGTETPAAAAVQPAAGETVSISQKKSNDKQCRALVKKVSKTPMTDAQLKKLLKKNKECRAVVIDSKAPATAASSAPNIVTIPAAAPAPAASSDDAYEDDDSYEDDDDGEYEDEDEGENNNNNNNFENEGEDD